MNERLSWEEISKRYDKEWIQLIDYVWPEGTPFPEAGVVRVHASDRKEFFRKVQELQPKQTESAFIYVGIPPKDAEVVHTNFHRIVQ